MGIFGQLDLGLGMKRQHSAAMNVPRGYGCKCKEVYAIGFTFGP